MSRLSMARSSKVQVLWAVVIVLAGLAVLIIATSLAGAREARSVAQPPGLLSTGATDEAVPLHAAPLATTRGFEQPIPGDSPHDPVLEVWQVLNAQRHGDFETAVDAWPTVPLAGDAEVWRHTARGQALLALGRLDAARDELIAARGLEPENAVVHYLFGLLRLEQAEGAMDFDDAVGRPSVRLASVRMPYDPDVVPNSKMMYQLAARVELQAAIDLASTVPFDQPLVPDNWTTGMALPPTVSDLLTAMGADNFAGKAHAMLGGIRLEDGQLGEAELHLKAAAASGLWMPFAFEDLAAGYEAQGDYLSAARCYAIATDHGMNPQEARRKAIKALRSFFNSQS